MFPNRNSFLILFFIYLKQYKIINVVKYILNVNLQTLSFSLIAPI